MKALSAWLVILLLTAVTAGAAPVLTGRWISTRIEAAHDNTNPSAGWAITFLADTRFTLERDEGFGLVATQSGTYRLGPSDLVLTTAGFRGRDPNEESFHFEETPTGLVLTDTALRITLVRSDAPHSALARMPAWPKTEQEAMQVLKTVIPSEVLTRYARTRSEWAVTRAHFGLGTFLRNSLGLWSGNQALWDDLYRSKGSTPEAWPDDERYAADGASYGLLRTLWDDLNADLVRPAFSKDHPDDPEHYFEAVADYLADAKNRNDQRALLFVPSWLLKDRPRRLAPWGTRPNSALIARAQALAAADGPLTYLALLYLAEVERTSDTAAIIRGYLDSERSVLWPRPRPRAAPRSDAAAHPSDYSVGDVDDVDDYAWSWVTVGQVAASCLRDLSAAP